MARVRKPDGEQTFAGSRGNDEVAPSFADITHRSSASANRLNYLTTPRDAKSLKRRSLTPSRRLRPSRSRAEVIRNGAIR
jgi:hypothetical protein